MFYAFFCNKRSQIIESVAVMLYCLCGNGVSVSASGRGFGYECLKCRYYIAGVSAVEAKGLSFWITGWMVSAHSLKMWVSVIKDDGIM